MLLSVLLQAAAGVGISKLGAAIGAGIAVLGLSAQVSQYWVQVSVSVKSVVLPWKLWLVSRKHLVICV